MDKIFLIITILLIAFPCFSNEKKYEFRNDIKFKSDFVPEHNLSIVKTDIENLKEGTSGKKGDYKDIAGFTVYISFSFLLTVSGIPLLAIGCYNYSINYPGDQTLPYIITGAVSLSIGVLMFSFLAVVTIMVLAIFKGFKHASGKKMPINIRVFL